MCAKKNTTSCNPLTCKAEVSYVCDKTSFQCKMVTGKPPAGAHNTSKECETTCYDNDVKGVWRGIRIDNGYVADEWDFTFKEATSGGVVQYKSKKTGNLYTGSYSIGAASTIDKQFSSFQLTIKLATGETLA